MRGFLKTAKFLGLIVAAGLSATAAAAASRAQVIELGHALAREMNSHLRKSEADLTKLSKWLEPHDKWPVIRAEECNQDSICTLNLRVLPMLHKKFRLYLALSAANDPLDWRLWELRSGGNPELYMPFGGPRAERQDRLSPAESIIAQNELIRFFDGRDLTEEEQDAYEIEYQTEAPRRIPGVIEDYIGILRRRIPMMGHTPHLRDLDEARLRALEESRKIRNPEARVQRAFLVHDDGWKHYREARLVKFHRENLKRAWSIIDQVRPLVYISKSRVTPAMVRAAFARAAEDSRRMREKVSATASRLTDSEADPRDEIEWLLDYPAIVEGMLAKNPDLENITTHVQRSIDRERVVWRSVTFAAILLPSVLMVPPIAAAAGAFGRVGLWAAGAGGATALTVDSHKAHEAQYEQYMARFHGDPVDSGWTNSDDVLGSQRRLVMSSFYFVWSLGPPTATLGLLRNLFR